MIYEYLSIPETHTIDTQTCFLTAHFRQQVISQRLVMTTLLNEAPLWAQALWRQPGVKCLIIEPYSVQIERTATMEWALLLPRIITTLREHLPEY